MITVGKTTVSPLFDIGTFKGSFNINNEYLSDFWFDCNHEIWDSISVNIAVIIEEIVKKSIKSKMNEESYKEKFLNCVEDVVEEKHE